VVQPAAVAPVQALRALRAKLFSDLEYENAGLAARVFVWAVLGGGVAQTNLAHTFKFTHTAFGSVKFASASVPCSRPKPESPAPPHGNRTSV